MSCKIFWVTFIAVFLIEAANGYFTNGTCFSGTRTTVDGNITEDNVASVWCNVERISFRNFTCSKIDLSYKKNGQQVVIERGFCNSINQVLNSSCKEFQNQSMASVYTETICVTPACNKFTQPKGCPIINTTDIHILPSCGLISTVSEALKCLNPLFAAYPYTSNQTCRSNMEASFSCLRLIAVKCLSGHCFDVLSVVQGVRQTLLNFLPRIQNDSTTLESFLDSFYLPNQTKDAIYGYSCLVKNGNYLKEAVAFVDSLQAQINRQNIITFCDANILNDLINKSVVGIRRFLNSTTHEQMCRSLSPTISEILSMWKSKCNKSEVISFLEYASKDFPPVAVEAKKGVNFIEDFLQTFILPSCETYFQTTTLQTVRTTLSTTPKNNAGRSLGNDCFNYTNVLHQLLLMSTILQFLFYVAF